MEFLAQKQCKKCRNIDEYQITKIEAAFSLKDDFIYNQACSKCGSKDYVSYSRDLVAVDQEILDIWGNNPSYHFLDQDEDLLLAYMQYMPILLNAVDNNLYPQEKLNIVILALCILLYDNTGDYSQYSAEESKKMQQNAAIIQAELLKRNNIIFKHQDVIMNYIKKRVFPLIDLKI
ncbi:hypothetical protein GCM10007424_04750 [Flavobacterium suaedae]|uniref:TerB family tellurite resistance protein n=1 Tax=Flavobacterium suaedae TaxID=1767027 RepID=A0ABQ1JFN5_9FLAO|nr:hypothetical protein [Flavobacterium suaedae]GGB67813.1 hypothetical protein GCM10007424_04750 [Flavobacterium suaedae]